MSPTSGHDLSHDLRISREALAAAERRAAEAERAAAALKDALRLVRQHSHLAQMGTEVGIAIASRDQKSSSKANAEIDRIHDAIDAALSTPIGSGWLSPAEAREILISELEAVAKDIGRDAKGERGDFAAGLWRASQFPLQRANDLRALAAHPTEEAKHE